MTKEIGGMESVTEGKVAAWLNGKKLAGGFALIRIGCSCAVCDDRDRSGPHWLLVKIEEAVESDCSEPVPGHEHDTED